MKEKDICKFLYIDDFSATPKYHQLANSILEAIKNGKIGVNELLPSINELSFEFEISRDTAEKAYKHLKKIGILGSVPGKGYFVESIEVNQPFKIFLLFNKLSAHKKIVYDSFVSSIDEQATIDFYIYNNDFSLFKKLIHQKISQYSHFVIIPHFIEGGEEAYKVINTIPKEKLVLLDKKPVGVTGEYAAVYENFEKDIYGVLEEARDHLQKYSTIKIIFPKSSYYPEEILKGLSRFCQDYAFNFKIVYDINTETIAEGEVYISVMENDLVSLIERLIQLNLNVGSQIGVISYNETPLKKVILNGITTISTDFQKMGEMAARLILDRSKEHVEVPFKLTLRNSL